MDTDMKIYRNKLYSIQDVAKRSGIEENQLRTLISVEAVKAERQFGIYYISGEEIPNIKNKWEWFIRPGERNGTKRAKKKGVK